MSKQMIDKAENAILHTYNRFQVVFDKGEGVYLYDTEGKQYLDFASGIGVQSLGYGNEAYKQALKDQIDKLTHISNLYYSTPMAEAAEKLVKATHSVFPLRFPPITHLFFLGHLWKASCFW